MLPKALEASHFAGKNIDRDKQRYRDGVRKKENRV